MPNDKHLPLCPFYKRHMYRSITCEDVNRTFSDFNEKEMWLRTYCDTQAWEKCEHAQNLNKAYENLFKGDDSAIMKNEYESLKREIKKLSTLLGKREKQVERQQKKIEYLYQKWREANDSLEAYEEHAANQVQVLVDAYETRIAYLVDTYGPFKDSDVDLWREGKEFALVADRADEGEETTWKVVFREDDSDKDIQEQKPE